MKKSYCLCCGSLEQETDAGRFNTETGEKLYKMACSNKSCSYYCYSNFGNHNYYLSSFWRAEMKCRNCDKISFNFINIFN